MSNQSPEICREGIELCAGFALFLLTGKKADPVSAQNMYRPLPSFRQIWRHGSVRSNGRPVNEICTAGARLQSRRRLVG